MRSTRRQFLRSTGLGIAGLALPWQGQAAGAEEAAGFAPAASPLLLGVNGHPYNNDAYTPANGVPYETQVAMLSALGMGIYRTDIGTDASGRAPVHNSVLRMMGLLGDAGIACMPMLGDNCDPALTNQQNYDRGFAKAAGFATHYGPYFTHVNLGNEWELNDGFKTGTGASSGHYDLTMAERSMHWIRGANDGLKSVKPAAKTSIAAAGWYPVWWQGYVLENVGLDFVDWHWYADMERNKSEIGVDNIFDDLWTRYGLPIWVSETNDRPNRNRGDLENQQLQVNWHQKIHQLCLEHPRVEAVIWYELLTQPQRDTTVPAEYVEANYGMVAFPGFDRANPDYTGWSYRKLPRRLMGADVLIGGFEGPSEGWTFANGPEFPGATGSFQRNDAHHMGGELAGLLSGDFTAGGAYVQVSRTVASLPVRTLRFWVLSSTVQRIGLRMTDSTGQTHQQTIAIAPDGVWQEVAVSDFAGGAGYVHFGGADDGVWHGPATRVGLVLDEGGLTAGRVTGAVRFDEVVATVQDVP
ncbi:glycosyl hydrolase [Jiangella sp. DSM 45060]|uniref:glycosyl hydrolase n=1 Tax=Jiangella sp. DSM 45060 TaxID=1798224 RepID=UPI00087D8F97|nr:glycosyl hydrolase [Jiangella sp. DSM 45060]SDS46532.1 Glycosyl hydrolase catalytic core [Jiangella sp. DSM 45060]